MKIMNSVAMICMMLLISACSVPESKKENSIDVLESEVVNGVDSDLKPLFIYLDNENVDTFSGKPFVNGEWRIRIDSKLLTDPNSERLKFNLPDGLNLEVKREKIVKCEDSPNFAKVICEANPNQYTWFGTAITKKNPDVHKIIISGGDSGISGSIQSGIPLEAGITRYAYTFGDGGLSGKEGKLQRIDPSKMPKD